MLLVPAAIQSFDQDTPNNNDDDDDDDGTVPIIIADNLTGFNEIDYSVCLSPASI